MTNLIASNPEENQPEGGNFAAGLLTGGIIAAAGIFLFGTKKGDRVRKDLESHWQKIQTVLDKEVSVRPGSPDKSKAKLSQLLKDTILFAAKTLSASSSNGTGSKPKEELLKKAKVIRTSKHSK